MSKTNPKEFDRSICFTFFEDFRKTASKLERDLGKEIVADYYNAIADYSLYGVMPELTGILEYIWPTTQTTIDKSIENRARGFLRGNTEQTETILAYKQEHPDASQNEIAKATGISKGKVNKVIKAQTVSDTIPYTDTTTNSVTTSNTIRDRDRDHATSESTYTIRRGLEDLTDEELESIKTDFSKRVDYMVTRERLGLNRQVSKEMQKEVDEILSQRKALAKTAEIEAQFSAMSADDVSTISNYLGCDSRDVLNNLSYLGVDAEYFLGWLADEDGSHAEVFSRNGEAWGEQEQQEEHDRRWKTYLDFVKMGIKANPIGVKHDYYW